MKELYPEIEASSVYQLDYQSIHSIYFEESGNPAGIPVIFLHGGPGSGCNENHRRYFDPEKYRIIIFDQPGCNRSSPQGELELNSTDNILAIIELIRKQLEINSWLVFGGSWGATLTLLYAERFPANVLALILRGSFLARETDLNWFLSDGVAKIFPDYWQELLVSSKASADKEVIKTIADAVFSTNKETQLKASIAWATWAGSIVTSSITSDYQLEIEDEDSLIHETRIEMHYAMNHYFIHENEILNNIANIPDVPITIIHGRRDLTCLPEASFLLHKALPQSSLSILAECGHLASEQGMIDALINATDEMATLL